MAHCSRRNFLKTGLAAGALAGTGSLPLRAARGTATDWVTLGKSGVKVTRLAFGTGTFSGRTQRELGQDQFTRLVRHAYDRGIRFFETCRDLRRDAQDAGRGAEGHSARYVPADVQGDDARRRESAGEDRRAAQAGEYRLLRRDAAALPARGDVADGHRALAGRNSGSEVEEGGGGTRRVGARAAGVAPVPGKQVARDRHDPDEPQGHQDGRRGLQHRTAPET